MDGMRILLYTDNAHLRGGAEEQMRREQQYLSERGTTVRSVGIGHDTGDAFTDEVLTDSESAIVHRVRDSRRISVNSATMHNRFETRNRSGPPPESVTRGTSWLSVG